MRNDISLQCQDLLTESHHGHPTVVTEELGQGQPGRPRVYIDPDFLAWAYTQRSISSIARFLGVHRHTVKRCLVEYGIVASSEALPPDHENPILPSVSGEGEARDPDELLDPSLPVPAELPSDVPNHIATHTATTLSDEDLDNLLLIFRSHHPRAGLSMIDGMLRTLGYHIPRTRIAEALSRIDPVRRVFQRIRIRRREYKVAGPNALWHHDGQHGMWNANLTIPVCSPEPTNAGLIRWGLVIHGFIDGYSCLITALRASNNNRADTVLDVFLSAATRYNVPSRVRGDHGVENLRVAEYMEMFRGIGRGSYIWGR